MPVDIAATVIENRRLSTDYNVLSFDAPSIAERAQPGQFVMIRTSRGLDPLLRRPFSIFERLRDATGRASGVSVLNKRVGVGSALLAGAAPGMQLDVLGPLGRGFEPIDPPTEAWLVAGGVGLAPFVTLAEALVARGTRATLFYGARRAAELYCVDLFERLGITCVLATEDGSRGIHGRVTVPLAAALHDRAAGREMRMYVCGPTVMMRACAQLAEAHGQRCDVSLEQVMGCGLGGCYSCVVLARTSTGATHHTRTCVDGPVFDARRIVWDAITGH
jgi:dihydroorotate dehydrogenase electron transfer subunit